MAKHPKKRPAPKRKLVNKIGSKLGMAPGSLVYTGEARAHPVSLVVHDYNRSNYAQHQIEHPKDLAAFLDPATTTWIQVIGVHDVEMLRGISEVLNINPLVMEDVLNLNQRPKVEFFDDYIYQVMRMLSITPDENGISGEQFNMILGKNFTLTFQENPNTLFDPLIKRIEEGRGRIRYNGQDYTAYALADLVVDHYFPVLEQLGEQAENLEERVLVDGDARVLHDIQALRKDLMRLRRAAFPLREAVTNLQRSDSALLKKENEPFFNDLHDHLVQVIETMEIYREMSGNILDTHFSYASARMNEIMKVLTIISTIFIPLGFLAGIYGMNFAESAYNMPELRWEYGYLYFWGLSFVVVSGLIYLFRRWGWF
ncbi:MAG TPA: magnesium/cobalt transporter CorA [Calditrichia bacterium]|nr:magnesium/cobalt transporter CorA [Calditrichota bacterium]HQU74498.1 magnesium/cobalt transporter CorA [Calditrichia bacterium]HQV31069.1 magnesium/cobalt transporter CorA [Calditrichia bacterium]